VPPKVRVWKRGERKGEILPLGDFDSIGGIPVFSQKAWDVMADLLEKDVEILPLQCSHGTLYLANVLRLLDCLDEKLSHFEYYSYGGIARVTRYTFRAGFQPSSHMFIIRGGGGNIFITDTLKERAECSQLRGFGAATFEYYMGNDPTPCVAMPATAVPGTSVTQPQWDGTRNQYGPLAPERLAAFEAELAQRLPEDYRAFLLAHNGGLPVGRDYWAPGRQEPDAEIRCVYGLHEGPEDYRLDVQRAFYAPKLMPGLLPIASDVGGNQFCLGYAGKPRGKVYCWDHETECLPVTWRNFQWLTGSFTEFLQRLRPAAP
jgi:hypothetical protein